MAILDPYPDAFNTWDSLGEASMERGDTDKAIASYEKWLEVNPDDADARQFIQRPKANAE